MNTACMQLIYLVEQKLEREIYFGVENGNEMMEPQLCHDMWWMNTYRWLSDLSQNVISNDATEQNSTLLYCSIRLKINYFSFIN